MMMWNAGVHAPADSVRARHFALQGCRLRYAPSCATAALWGLPKLASERQILEDAAGWLPSRCRADPPEPWACAATARIAALGIGDAAGTESVLVFQAEACRAGLLHSCQDYVRFAEQNEAQAPEIEAVLDRLEAACAETPASYCEGWIRARHQGVGGARVDETGSKVLAEALCDAEVAIGCAWAAYFADEDGDTDGGARLRDEACRKGHTSSCGATRDVE
jgi:hypothetical protein